MGVEQSFSSTLLRNSVAINGLGYMHMYGMGVEQSFAEAMKLFSRAAEQSFAEAMKLFSRAAAQGNLDARFNLGALYVGGFGVAKDYAKALYYSTLAANRGHMLALYNLAYCADDYAKALYYFTLAANRGHMLALYNLAMMHLHGFGTPKSCTNALTFLKSVAERGAWGTRLQDAYKLHQ
ncbi:hypothetical protein T484DRAFT_1820092, partial [Baffinella frigidus]